MYIINSYCIKCKLIVSKFKLSQIVRIITNWANFLYRVMLKWPDLWLGHWQMDPMAEAN